MSVACLFKVLVNTGKGLMIMEIKFVKEGWEVYEV
jgi:hypothetical protein